MVAEAAGGFVSAYGRRLGLVRRTPRIDKLERRTERPAGEQ
jgi:hypothetical protein